jgi:riboflavin kinase/FMN adenylyltransferase
MQIIRNFQNINHNLQNTVLTIGNFDGIHLGHQEVLKFSQHIADKQNLKSALLTFEPHPLKIIRPNIFFDQKLYCLSQKLFLLKNQSLIDIAFVTGFNHQMANLSAQSFVETILVKKLKIKHLIVGYDFIFGKNRLGNASLLQKLAKIHNFCFHQISAKSNNSQQIYSSTKIRNLIKCGDITLANQMLGKNYQVSGIVIKGKQIARNLGFATANFLPKLDLIKPKFGVYKASVWIENKQHFAIMNFGIKPTFVGQIAVFEVHIFNFNQEIYGKKITVELLDFIREEIKFNSIEELKKQIKKDIDSVHKTLNWDSKNVFGT